MDLRGLGAFLSAIGGFFSAKAGATAGQLQGLLMGEDITERRKRMKMAEEAHELQKRLAETEEARRAELFPIQKGMLQQQYEQQGELFPYQKEALATQVEAGKLNLLNNRLWTMYQRGVVPSQINDPVLRAEYEPFFNFQRTANSLQWVRSQEELDKLLEGVSEEWRPTLEILGRESLLKNQMQQQMWERQLQGLDLNLAQGEFQLRSFKLNYALNVILNNINSEGMDWDKRTPQQKIEAVKKWIKQLGLDDVVPEDFANMFQRVKSDYARQLALYRAQAELNYTHQSRLLGQQIAGNIKIQDRTMWNNLVLGALGLYGGQGGVAPVGFGATDMPPAPVVFNTTPDNQGNYLNQTALNNYLKAPMNITVPVRVGNQYVPTPLSNLQSQAGNIYKKLGRPDASITANEINTLISYDAGLLQAQFAKSGMELDWNSALMWATDRILPTLKNAPAYRGNINFQKTLNDWERAWQQTLQQRAGGGGQSAGQPPARTAPTRGQSPAPARQGGGQAYSSQARRRRD